MISFLIGLIIGAWIGFGLAAMCAVSSWESRREELRNEKIRNEFGRMDKD